MLLLWVVITAGLLAVALVLNTSGHWACTRRWERRASLPVPQHADASYLMSLRLLAEAFPHGQLAGCAIVELGLTSAHDRQHRPARERRLGARRPAGYLS